MKIRLIISLISIALLCAAQEERAIINGAIQFDYAGVDSDNIIISNTQTGETTTTNILGQFLISAKEGDVLEVKGLNIFTENFIVSSHQFNRKGILLLLEPLVIPLSELEVSGFKFTGNLEVDTKRVKKVDSLNDAIQKMGLPIGKERDELAHINKAVWKPEYFLSADLDALYDWISGEKKRKLALYNYNVKWNIVRAVRSYFSDSYFNETLKIPNEEIDPFIFTLIEIADLEELYNARDYYTIMHTMQKFAPEYLNRLKIRDASKK